MDAPESRARVPARMTIQVSDGLKGKLNHLAQEEHGGNLQALIRETLQARVDRRISDRDLSRACRSTYSRPAARFFVMPVAHQRPESAQLGPFRQVNRGAHVEEAVNVPSRSGQDMPVCPLAGLRECYRYTPPQSRRLRAMLHGSDLDQPQPQ